MCVCVYCTLSCVLYLFLRNMVLIKMPSCLFCSQWRNFIQVAAREWPWKSLTTMGLSKTHKVALSWKPFAPAADWNATFAGCLQELSAGKPMRGSRWRLLLGVCQMAPTGKLFVPWLIFMCLSSQHWCPSSSISVVTLVSNFWLSSIFSTVTFVSNISLSNMMSAVHLSKEV